MNTQIGHSLALLGLALAVPGAVMAQATCAVTHTISAIQGNSATQGAGGAHNDISPLDGQVVTIEGIVVGDFQAIPQSTRAGELRARAPARVA